jgi:hypothetical protein
MRSHQLGSDGLGELTKGIHFGRLRKLELEQCNQGVRLTTYPLLIDVQKRRKISALDLAENSNVLANRT